MVSSARILDSIEPLIFINLQTDASYVKIDALPQKNLGKVISLFTGAGGMEIGLESAGYETAVCVEINADCRETLRKNRPNWKLFEDSKGRIPGDIRNITTKELLSLANLKKGEAALVTGGAPCQPFSNIGKKQGKEDESNGDLFLEFVRIVREAAPKAFIFENVAGITQAKHHEVVQYMKDQFDGLGYSIAFQILNAADYGVPQQRKRFIMIGTLKGKAAFPMPTHIKGLKEWQKFTADLDVKPSFQPLPWITAGKALKTISAVTLKRPDCLAMNHSVEMKKRMSLIRQGENFKVLPMKMRPKCWQSGKHQGQDTFGRIEADKPAPTIRTAGYNPTKGKYIHPYEDRGLNTMEMAVFQSFPKEWSFHCAGGRPTIVGVGRQIGNAVPPLFAAALGKAIARQIEASEN